VSVSNYSRFVPLALSIDSRVKQVPIPSNGYRVLFTHKAVHTGRCSLGIRVFQLFVTMPLVPCGNTTVDEATHFLIAP